MPKDRSWCFVECRGVNELLKCGCLKMTLLCLCLSLKVEYDKLANEKTEMQRHYVMVRSRYNGEQLWHQIARLVEDLVRVEWHRAIVITYVVVRAGCVSGTGLWKPSGGCDAAGCYRAVLSDRQPVGLQGLTAALPSVCADLIILLGDSTLRRMHGHKLGVSCWWRPIGAIYMCESAPLNKMEAALRLLFSFSFIIHIIISLYFSSLDKNVGVPLTHEISPDMTQRAAFSGEVYSLVLSKHARGDFNHKFKLNMFLVFFIRKQHVSLTRSRLDKHVGMHPPALGVRLHRGCRALISDRMALLFESNFRRS